MRGPRIAQDFIPVSEFKAKAADYLRRLGEGDGPVVVTLNGRPAGVLLSPQSYDELMERARLVAAIEQGVADADAGRVRPHAEVARRLRARFSAKGT